MEYHRFLPHPSLREYIDAYWVVRNSDHISHSNRILPDGCVDVIVNIGGTFVTDNGSFKMLHEAVCLVGTMTHYIHVDNLPGTHLIGIRFKPLGFSAFYKFGSLHEVTNKTVDIDRSFIPDIHVLDSDSIVVLNSFFMGRLSTRSHVLKKLADHIDKHRGHLTVKQLSREYAISMRQLERSFKQHIGVSPKEFINFKRYEYALKRIHQRRADTSLLDIAVDCGYYDHSHLTNEIRKYSGLIPSIL